MRWGVVVALALIAGRALAHSLAPEEVVASMADPAARVSMGIERVTIDPRNPRVLLVRVGPGWFGLPAAARVAAADAWRASWRTAVPQGVVAVLDAGTSEPVVHYGLDGRESRFRARP